MYVAVGFTLGHEGSSNAEVRDVSAVRFGLDNAAETISVSIRPARNRRYSTSPRAGNAVSKSAIVPSPESAAAEINDALAGNVLVSASLERDLDLLERAGVLPPPRVLDLLEVAEIFLPTAPDYSLNGICQFLGIRAGRQDEAAEAAGRARRLLLALHRQLAGLPAASLHEIERLAFHLDPEIGAFVGEALAIRRQSGAEASPTVTSMLRQRPDGAQPQSLTPNAGRTRISPDQAEKLLLGVARLPQHLPSFERREEQIRMTRAVAEALSDETPLIVEAGTGTGKSLAYLAPAALHAIRNNSRVVVSTNTISLQEQLIGKDIPVVQALVAGSGQAAKGDELRGVTLKGRRNYLCLRRWTNLLRSPDPGPAEARFLVRLIAWLAATETGDRAEFNLSPDEETLWDRVCAGNESCFDSGSPFVREGTCFVLRARRRAEAAHLVVVNHALLLSDLVAGGHVIPGYDDLVIDEAHNLESEATRQFGFSASENDVVEYLNGIYNAARIPDTGLAGNLRNAVRGTAASTGPGQQAVTLVASLVERVERARSQVGPLFRLLEAFMRGQADESGEYDRRLLLTPGVRSQAEWSQIEIAWENAQLTLSDTLKLLGQVQTLLVDSADIGFLDYDALLAETSELISEGSRLSTGISEIINRHDPKRVVWLSAHRTSGAITLASAPLDVSDLLREQLWLRKDSVILTSATLSTEGKFDYIRNRLGLDESEELLLGSPFDYERSTLLLVPRDMPEPNHPNYPSVLADAVIDLCTASQGRALILLTSYGALRALHRAVKRPLSERGIAVLGQGIDGSPRQLLQALRDKPGTVVLGTASFWEGVDVAGDSLSLLVIAKLPFSVPNDPIFASRSALFENPFMEYALPEAVLRFKQGFGRLIRRKTDRGVMAVLDPRITSRRYGSAFLQSVPKCTLREGLLRQFPRAIESWLGPAAPK